MKGNPRRSIWHGTRLFVLVGCSCLWGLLMALTARDFLAYNKNESVSSAWLELSDYKGDCHTYSQRNHNETASENEIRGLFDRWNDALLTGDPKAVAELYLSQTHNGVKNNDSELMLLLPTLSNEPRTNLAGVEDYFVAFLKRKPRGRIVSGKILMGPDGMWALDAGLYEFVLENNNSEDKNKRHQTSVVRARYSFLYLRDERCEWKIAHHHSSLMPER